jgi:ubiquinone/menaquinone biosynthesis C-methylase UbiE
MLARILEPEVMDTPDEARDYDAMDHSTVNRVFVADFLAAWDGANPVLDVGTGTAQIPIELCRQSDLARVVAIDLAREMLRVAEANVVRAGLAQRIEIQLVDAKTLPFADRAFRAIISNSIVHHIPEPATVLAEMIRVAAPGATLFVRDLLRPDDDATLQRLVATYAGDANAHQQKMFSESLHAALTLAEIRTLVMSLGYNGETVQQTTDRHWTWCARKAHS